MNNHFIPTIGIEVHVALNSISKMFSPQKSSHTDLINTNINPIDLGHPGTMPTVNKACVNKAILLAKALKMQISNFIAFDRKNYFYQDLPKGFQITQQFFPIGLDGKIELENDQIVNVQRIHMEEDTAKQNIDINGNIYLDYNRSGMPLIEVVTYPCISNGKTAAGFLKKLKQILVFNNISDAKMEEGSMRVDVNVSIAAIGSKIKGTRVEIKNINSIYNVEKAIEYEVNYQIKQILNNQKVVMATKRFDDKKMTTEFMRLKTTNVDYHYMVEPNIIAKSISNQYIDDVIKNQYVDLDLIISDLKKVNIESYIINLLLDDYDLYKLFKLINDHVNNPNQIAKWIINELVGTLNKFNKSIKNLDEHIIKQIIKLNLYLKETKINSKQAKEITNLIIQKNLDIDVIMQQNNYIQITDINVLSKMINDLINSNINLLIQFKDRPERVIKFFMGKVMGLTKGQANPQIVNDLVIKLIKEKVGS